MNGQVASLYVRLMERESPKKSESVRLELGVIETWYDGMSRAATT